MQNGFGDADEGGFGDDGFFESNFQDEQAAKPAPAPAQQYQPQAPPTQLSSQRYGQSQHQASSAGYAQPSHYARQSGNYAATGNGPAPGPSQTHAPQRQQHSQSGFEEGAFFPSEFRGVGGGVLNQQLAGAAYQMGSNMLHDQLGQHFSHINASMFSYAYYRSYFAVSNAYVLNKLKILFLPFLHKSWRRQQLETLGGQGQQNPPPREDVNAPDGYIPLMAFFTYILTMGYMIGILANKDRAPAAASGSMDSEDRVPQVLLPAVEFSPEILFTAGSTAVFIMIAQTMFLKLGFYLVGGSSAGWIDCICYSGYKFVMVVVNIILFLCFGSLMVYWVCLVVTSILSAYFILKTLLGYFQGQMGMATDAKNARNIFLLLAAILEVSAIGWLGRSAV